MRRSTRHDKELVFGRNSDLFDGGISYTAARRTNCRRRHIMQDATTPNQNARLYVIGDIHGRLDLLDDAIAAIKRDVEAQGLDALTVTLGDYVDRGPKSPGVIDRLLANPFPTPHVALKGNHELLLETFLVVPS